MFILVRCSFRVAELKDGFAGDIANDEGLFMALEGPMIMLATLCMTLSHPGYDFNGEWNEAVWSLRETNPAVMRTAARHHGKEPEVAVMCEC